MKRFRALLFLSLSALCLLCSCSPGKNDEFSFDATVLSNGGNHLLVQGLDESDDQNFRSQFKATVGLSGEGRDVQILNSQGEPINPEDVLPGNIVRIVYDGNILEPNPAIILGTIRIEVLED